MALLKWSIWLVILIIAVSLYRRQKAEAERETDKELVAVSPMPDTTGSDSTFTPDEKEFKRMALNSLITHYKLHLADKDSGSLTFVYATPKEEMTIYAKHGPIIGKNLKHIQVHFIRDGKQQSLIINPTVDDSPILVELQDRDFSGCLQDINGDGYLDLFFREGTKTRMQIFDDAANAFKPEATYENICFSPSEKLARGKLENGPVFFKLKWVGTELYPVEYLYPHKDNPNWLIKSDSLFGDPYQATGTTLWYLPKEYRNLDACLKGAGLW